MAMSHGWIVAICVAAIVAALAFVAAVGQAQ